MTDRLESLDVGNNGIIIHYNGEEDIPDLSTRNDIIEQENAKSIQLIRNHIKSNKKMFFLPSDINENCNKPYVLRLFGTLVNGEKAEVNITGIDVFFDVLVPHNIAPECIHRDLLILLPNEIYHRIEDIRAQQLYGFRDTPQHFKRIYTRTTSDRKVLLDIVKRDMKLETFSNDTSHYYRKAAREYKLALCKWVTLENYIYQHTDIHSFIVNVTDYKLLTNEHDLSSPHISKDKTLVMAWDIETYSSRGTGDVPTAEYDEDKVFMICLSVHWLHSAEALQKICIVDKEIESDDRWISIVCGSEYNILRAFAICWNHYKPDIFSGYNDSGYDWPFIMEKATKYDVLPWMWNKMSLVTSKNIKASSIIRFNYNNGVSRRIKINAEKDFDSKCPIVSGTVCIDVLPCFMKIYPRSETTKYGSLKFYLQDNNLPSKIDLSPIMLWKYYVEGNLSKMREIAYYCIVDTISVQRLLVKRNIISDYREISSLAYVSLSDSHYYAGGVKVCNLLGSYAWDCNILVNMSKDKRPKSLKYPGAYVFPPDKGITPNIQRIKKLRSFKSDEELDEIINDLYKDRPVACFDFASLYPSLIITYNLSPEKILLTQEEHDQWCSTYRLHKIEFTLGTENKVAWSVLHNNEDKMMGLFPIILRQLFAKRKEMKKKLKEVSDKKIVYEQVLSHNDNYDKVIKDMINEATDDKRLLVLNSINTSKINEEYANLCFEYNYINSKQNALKIYMNTFYGETGNQLSPYFLLELAGGVTSAGQYNIKLIADFLRQRQYNIKYGDTDSLYITCPNHIYREFDLLYAYEKITKEEYYTYLVNTTLKLLPEIENSINQHLEQDNGTTYLRMENEGCNFPFILLGKKKYFGKLHLTVVNFYSKKIYIKGIEVIKQGKSKIEKEIGNNIMNMLVSIHNELNVSDIVKQTLYEAVHSDKWTIDDYARTSSWKPNKNNQSVQCFMKRMAQRHVLEKQENEIAISQGLTPKEYEYMPLEPGEKFSYVLVDNNILFDLQGRNIAIKTGDMMEYLHIAKKYNKTINVVYYLIHYIISICARFINSEDRFLPTDTSLTDKQIDEYSIKLAKKELEVYIKDIRNISQVQLNSIRENQKLLFKQSVNYSITKYPHLRSIINGPLKKLAFIDYTDDGNVTDYPITDIIFKTANKNAEKMYKTYYSDYCKILCERFGINFKTGSDLNNSTTCINLYECLNLSYNQFNMADYNIRKEISDIANIIIDISIEYKTSISYIIEKIKNNQDITTLDIVDNEKISIFYNLWYRVIAVELCNLLNKEYKNYLLDIKNKRIKLEQSIPKKEIKDIITEASYKYSNNTSLDIFDIGSS